MLLVSKSTGPSSDDSLTAIVQRLDTLQTSNEQLRELNNNKLVQKSADWSSSFTKLNLTVDKLEASNSRLEASDSRLEALNSRLEASNSKLEASNSKLEASISKLEKELAKERDDRKVETDRLEERLEEQDQSHTTRLAEEKATRIRDMQSITEV